MVDVVSPAYVAMFANIGPALVHSVLNGVLVYLALALVVWIASRSVGSRSFALVTGVRPWRLPPRRQAGGRHRLIGPAPSRLRPGARPVRMCPTAPGGSAR